MYDTGMGAWEAGLAARFHPHALNRMRERGVLRREVRQAIISAQPKPGPFGRTHFQKVFAIKGKWIKTRYHKKQIDAYATNENDRWLVISVNVKYS